MRWWGGELYGHLGRGWGGVQAEASASAKALGQERTCRGIGRGRTRGQFCAGHEEDLISLLVR